MTTNLNQEQKQVGEDPNQQQQQLLLRESLELTKSAQSSELVYSAGEEASLEMKGDQSQFASSAGYGPSPIRPPTTTNNQLVHSSNASNNLHQNGLQSSNASSIRVQGINQGGSGNFQNYADGSLAYSASFQQSKRLNGGGNSGSIAASGRNSNRLLLHNFLTETGTSPDSNHKYRRQTQQDDSAVRQSYVEDRRNLISSGAAKEEPLINSNEVREIYAAEEYFYGDEIGHSAQLDPHRNINRLTETTQTGLDKYLISHSGKLSPAQLHQSQKQNQNMIYNHGGDPQSQKSQLTTETAYPTFSPYDGSLIDKNPDNEGKYPNSYMQQDADGAAYRNYTSTGKYAINFDQKDTNDAPVSSNTQEFFHPSHSNNHQQQRGNREDNGGEFSIDQMQQYAIGKDSEPSWLIQARKESRETEKEAQIGELDRRLAQIGKRSSTNHPDQQISGTGLIQKSSSSKRLVRQELDCSPAVAQVSSSDRESGGRLFSRHTRKASEACDSEDFLLQGGNSLIDLEEKINEEKERVQRQVQQKYRLSPQEQRRQFERNDFAPRQMTSNLASAKTPTSTTLYDNQKYRQDGQPYRNETAAETSQGILTPQSTILREQLSMVQNGAFDQQRMQNSDLIVHDNISQSADQKQQKPQNSFYADRLSSLREKIQRIQNKYEGRDRSNEVRPGQAPLAEAIVDSAKDLQNTSTGQIIDASNFAALTNRGVMMMDSSKKLENPAILDQQTAENTDTNQQMREAISKTYDMIKPRGSLSSTVTGVGGRGGGTSKGITRTQNRSIKRKRRGTKSRSKSGGRRNSISQSPPRSSSKEKLSKTFELTSSNTGTGTQTAGQNRTQNRILKQNHRLESAQRSLKKDRMKGSHFSNSVPRKNVKKALIANGALVTEAAAPSVTKRSSQKQGAQILPKYCLQRNNNMSQRVKILIGERKINREKLEKFENELKIMSDKLFLTKQKKRVTENSGKRTIEDLKTQVQLLTDSVTQHQRNEQKLRRRIQEASFRTVLPEIDQTNQRREHATLQAQQTNLNMAVARSGTPCCQNLNTISATGESQSQLNKNASSKEDRLWQTIDCQNQNEAGKVSQQNRQSLRFKRNASAHHSISVSDNNEMHEKQYQSFGINHSQNQRGGLGLVDRELSHTNPHASSVEEYVGGTLPPRNNDHNNFRKPNFVPLRTLQGGAVAAGSSCQAARALSSRIHTVTSKRARSSSTHNQHTTLTSDALNVQRLPVPGPSNTILSGGFQSAKVSPPRLSADYRPSNRHCCEAARKSKERASARHSGTNTNQQPGLVRQPMTTPQVQQTQASKIASKPCCHCGNVAPTTKQLQSAQKSKSVKKKSQRGRGQKTQQPQQRQSLHKSVSEYGQKSPPKIQQHPKQVDEQEDQDQQMVLIEKDGSTKIVANIPTVSFHNQSEIEQSSRQQQVQQDRRLISRGQHYPQQIHNEMQSSAKTPERDNQSEIKQKQQCIAIYQQNDFSDSLQKEEPQTELKSAVQQEQNMIDTQRADPEEMRVLREQLAQMSQQVQKLKSEKDQWKSRAKKLATNYLGTLKELKAGLYSVKKDASVGIEVAKDEFQAKLGAFEQFLNVSRGGLNRDLQEDFNDGRRDDKEEVSRSLNSSSAIINEENQEEVSQSYQHEASRPTMILQNDNSSSDPIQTTTANPNYQQNVNNILPKTRSLSSIRRSKETMSRQQFTDSLEGGKDVSNTDNEERIGGENDEMDVFTEEPDFA